MLLVQPFIEFAFMRKALVACVAIAISATPLGVFLSLRRMSLVGDALSHAVLPGAAMGYLLSGLSLVAMGIGGLIAGLSVALLSGVVSRFTPLKEDASFSGFYLGALALGVTLISLRRSGVDLLNVLFGSLLAVNSQALIMVASISALSLVVLAFIYRPLVIDAFDPHFLQMQGRWHAPIVHGIFLILVVLNLVAGFQILGTLMSVGLMMLPAASARFWSRRLEKYYWWPLCWLFSPPGADFRPHGIGRYRQALRLFCAPLFCFLSPCAPVLVAEFSVLLPADFKRLY